MAVKIRNLGSGGTQDALLKQLMEQYGEQSTPKVGGLGRIMAPLSAIGSAIDAYHDARYEDKNAGVLNVLKNYGKNLAQGMGTLVSGTNYENMENTSELLDKLNPNFKRSALGKSAIGRMGIDIVGGLLTDPTTYFSFGAASLADDTIKSGLKAAGVGKKTIAKLLPKLTGGTTDDIVKTLSGMSKIGKKVGADVADNFYVSVMQNVGKGTTKSGALKLLGKTVTQNPTAVKIAKGVVSPLGAGMDAVGWASKKFTPGLRADLLDVFDPVQGAIEMGKGKQAAALLKFNRESSSLYRGVFGELRDAGLIDKFNKLSDDEKARMAKLIESSRETAYKASQIEGLLKRKDELFKALKNYTGTEGVVPETIWPDRPAQRGFFDIPEAEFLEESNRKAIVSNKGIEDFYLSLDDEQKGLIDPLLLKLDSLNGKKLTEKKFNNILDDVFGNQIDNKGQLLRLPDGLSKNAKGFISDYFALERGQTEKMTKLGLPTIDARKMGYISRDPIGYKPKLLKSTLDEAGMGDVYEKLMTNKNVLKDLADKDLGYVKKETLQKVLDANEFSALKQYDPGMLGELISGGGATKGRVFETLQQAEAAGMVYGKNPLKNIYDQTVRQNEQLLAANFVNEMVADETSFSKTAKGLMRTPVTIPGAGVFYTDKHMAKIAEDYVSKYTTEDGINKLLTGFDKIQAQWKRWVTGLGPNAPAYNIRNLIDDNIRVIVGGGDITHLPGDYRLAMDMFDYEDLLNKVGKKEALKQLDQSRAAKFLESVGVKSDNPLDELWNRTIKGGVHSDTSKSLSEMSISEPRDIQEALGLEKSKKLGERLGREYEDVMTLKGKLPRREQATRMATYFNFWRKEGAESAGLDAVKNISFNYNELSKTEKTVLKRIIPFYGFVKNNLKFYMDLIKDNPEKLARYYNVYEGLQSGSQSAFGEDWEAMPDYVKETLSIPFSKTKEGELKYLSGLNLGIEGLGDIPFGPTDQTGLRKMAGNLSPELSMLLELVSGKDLYKGEDILEDNQGYNYANRSDLLKSLMNYQKYPVELDNGKTYDKQTVAPEFKYLLENVPFVSTLNTGAKRISDFKNKKLMIESLTNMLFPVRINKSKVDEAKERIKKREEQDLYKLLQKRGIADVYKSFYIPKGLREQLFK